MAAVVVTADNNRIEDCDDATEAGFSSIGGGAGASAEAPFAYQGTLLVNRKITSATGAGFYYEPTADAGSAQDMTVTRRRAWMVKTMVSDYGGLDATDGVRVRIGSGTADFYAFVLAGSDSPVAVMAEYRAVGGLLVFPVDPNENSAYSDSGKNLGTPVLTAVDYFAGVWAFTASSAKNENCGIDAIDIGSGLYLVGGDGGDADGLYQDFVDFDEGTVNNRFGYARQADGGGILAFGEWRIGTDDDSTSTATVFVDNVAVINWLDGMFTAGFSRVAVDLGDAGTDVTDGALHIGAGTTANVDTRPDYVITGTAGVCLLTGTLRNFRNVTLTSACTINGEVECQLLTQGSADIENAVIKTNALTSVACLQDPTFGTTTDLNNTEFVETGAGHAVEIPVVGSYTLTELTWTGYGADTTDDAALDLTATTGTYNLTISGGTTPTFKTAGATVNIIAGAVDTTITVKDENDAALENARVLVEAGDGTGDLPFEDSVTITNVTTTASVSHTAHGMSDGEKVVIRGADQQDYNGVFPITNVTTNAYDYTMSGDPGTNATGTITATGAVVEGLTNVSGVVTASAPFTVDQNVRGVVRKSTSTPFYKLVSFTDVVDKDTGLAKAVQMVLDE